jgi:alpha-beta hydrolase superfamily lysophospholipase
MGFYDLPAFARQEQAIRPLTSPLLSLDATGANWTGVLSRFGGSNLSGLNQLSDVRAPLLLVHGDADRVVPVEHSIQLREAAAAARRTVTLEIVAGMGHDIHQLHGAWPTLWMRIKDFFDAAFSSQPASPRGSLEVEPESTDGARGGDRFRKSA